MKKLLFRITVFMLFFFVVFSCEREEISQEKAEKDILQTVSIDEAKKSIIGEALISTKGGELESSISFNWDKVTQEEILNSEAQMTVVPVLIEGEEEFNRVLFLKVNGVLQKVICTLTYADKEKSDAKEFTGRVFIRKLDGQFLLGYEITEGKMSGLLHPIVTKSGFSLGKTTMYSMYSLPEVEVTARRRNYFPLGYIPLYFYDEFPMESDFMTSPEFQYAMWHCYKGSRSTGSKDNKDNTTKKIKRPKKKNPNKELPRKKPKKVINDCNSKLTATKEKMKTDYDIFSNYKGDTKLNRPAFQDFLNKVKADSGHEHSLEFYEEKGNLTTSSIISDNNTHNVNFLAGRTHSTFSTRYKKFS